MTKYEIALISRPTLLKCSHIPYSGSTIRACETREQQEIFARHQKEQLFLGQRDNCVCCTTVRLGHVCAAHLKRDRFMENLARVFICPVRKPDTPPPPNRLWKRYFTSSSRETSYNPQNKNSPALKLCTSKSLTLFDCLAQSA